VKVSMIAFGNTL